MEGCVVTGGGVDRGVGGRGPGSGVGRTLSCLALPYLYLTLPYRTLPYTTL